MVVLLIAVGTSGYMLLQGIDIVDALFWSPEYEYSETRMGEMLHDMDRLQDWLETVPPDPELEK